MLYKTLFKSYIKFIFCFLFVGAFKLTDLNAQNKGAIDSLQLILKTAKEDTNKVKTLYKLSSKLRIVGDYKNALKLALMANDLSKKLLYELGLANSWQRIGLIYIDQNNYTKALGAMLKSLRSCLKMIN